LSEFEKFAELVKDCNELNDVDLTELLKDIQTTTTEVA
jgi:hypothetical protein